MNRAGFVGLCAFLGVGFAVEIAAAQGAGAPAHVDPHWLKVQRLPDGVHVTFQLIAGLTGLNGALNFNGFRDGGLTVTVPRGATVVMPFHNHDGMLPHSAEVIASTSPVPPGPVTPVFSGAFTTRLEQGLPPQGEDTMQFVADKAGSYLIFCGVPGHGLQGMWIRFRVAGSSTRASVAPTGRSGSSKK